MMAGMIVYIEEDKKAHIGYDAKSLHQCPYLFSNTFSARYSSKVPCKNLLHKLSSFQCVWTQINI